MYLYTTPSARQLTIDCLVERVCLDPYVARTTVPRRAKLNSSIHNQLLGM
jgi:hypothetical protein